MFFIKILKILLLSIIILKHYQGSFQLFIVNIIKSFDKLFLLSESVELTQNPINKTLNSSKNHTHDFY